MPFIFVEKDISLTLIQHYYFSGSRADIQADFVNIHNRILLPGLSRSGTTIATGLLLGDNKAKLAQFSFLMVMPPILGEGLLDGIKLMKGEDIAGSISTLSLLIGFIAAFVAGCLACKWMINIVKKGKLVYFAVYCAIAGIVTIVLSQMQG